jgi:UDP-2,3-diacylglucosamine hydrolase
VPTYLASDIHLRLDRPDRGRRFATFLEGLQPGDPLILGGDLCDFWFASRQGRSDPMDCPGLRALAEFVSRGGSVTAIVGNHDAWLGPFYEKALGVRVVPEPIVVEAHGVRVRVVHGHLLGARSVWKGAMESRAFLSAFGWVPGPLARGFETLLDRTNEGGRAESDRRHLAVYSRYAESHAEDADLVAFGHIHRPKDLDTMHPRVVILGGWIKGESYLIIDEEGAALVIRKEMPAEPSRRV